MIVAYKGVVKEKEALEASVKALVTSERVPNTVLNKSCTKADSDGQEEERPDSCETKASLSLRKLFPFLTNVVIYILWHSDIPSLQ